MCPRPHIGLMIINKILKQGFSEGNPSTLSLGTEKKKEGTEE